MPHPSTPRSAYARILTAGLTASLLLGSLACSSSSSSDDGQMNLLFISIDTLRADHVGCYGYDRPTTPSMDALAADGHRFESAYTVMATTLPAHLSMFTSLFPAQTGVYANGYQVPDGVETLAERMSAAGYRTGGFVSAIPLDKSLNIGQGFDAYDSPGKDPRKGAATAALAMEWIDSSADKDAPFFCFVHSYDPHSWYQTDEAIYTEPFDAPTGVQLPPDRGFLDVAIDAATRKQCMDAYDAGIRYADAQVGALLEFLDARGLRDNTIVVVLSDHGETLDELYDSHQYAFDHGEFLSRRELRIPLIIWLPESYAERGPAVHDDLVDVLDLMPTLLDLLGLPCAKPVFGRSLAGLMAGETLAPGLHYSQRRTLERRDQKHLSGQELSITDGRWHWIRSQARKNELFDMKTDPAETRDVSAENRERVQSLRRLIETWIGVMAKPLWNPDGELSEDLAEALKALGYTTGEEVDTSDDK